MKRSPFKPPNKNNLFIRLRVGKKPPPDGEMSGFRTSGTPKNAGNIRVTLDAIGPTDDFSWCMCHR